MTRHSVSVCSVLVSFLFCMLLCACGEKTPSAIRKISVYSGGAQCAAPGKPFPEDLRIGVYDKSGAPVPGKKLKFIPEDADGLTVEPAEAETGSGGLASVKVSAGNKTGDQYLNVVPVDTPDKALSVRFVSGVEILGTDAEREGSAGHTLPDAVGVRVLRADGAPAANVPVYFNSDLKLGKQRVMTDEKGEARTSVTLGNKTAEYKVNIEIPQNQFRTITVRALGLDFYTLLINVFGGLALFVLGMKFMSDGLQKAAGEKMRSILHLFSSNRFVAIIAGVIVTAVVQSSSASTVMVIGFVNAGLLSLVQSIGIIFGANIGTTITAQIISFNISAVAMPAIVLGLLLSFLKFQKLNGWGEAVLGFGLLFFGLTVMSSELKAIAAFPSFVEFFKLFKCAPIHGVMPLGALLGALLVGVVATVVVQSSAAVIGIVFALATSGLLDVYTGVTIVLGSNIGTTITAQLAAIPANRIAKQTALAHTLFNVIGVVALAATFWIPWGSTGVPVFFYLVGLLTEGGMSFSPQNVSRHIANAHTIFNIFATLLLLPFIPLLARICERVIPLSDKKVKYQYLEPHLLNTPAVALSQTVFALRKMLKKAWKMVDRAVLKNFLPCDTDPAGFELLDKREKRIDRYQLEITDYLVKITRKSLSKSQADLVPLLMHCTNDAERIADHTAIILALTTRLSEAEQRISDIGKEELTKIYAILEKQAKDTIASLDQYAPELAESAISAEKTVLRLADLFENNHIQRLNAGQCNAVTGVIFIEMLGEISKVSRHLANIAERTRSICLNYRKVTLEHSKVSKVPMQTLENVIPSQEIPLDPSADDDDPDTPEKH